MVRRRQRNEDVTPLLAEEGAAVNTESSSKSQPSTTRFKEGDDWDPNLPYGGKVYLPRKKKDDPMWVTVVEVLVLLGTFLFALYAYYYFDRLHFHITHGYAHLGYASAQHQVGQRFLHGIGTPKDHHTAMGWFKKAADQGHPHASYNLAVGHLKGLRTDLLQRGDPHRLIQHAASQGVREAHQVLNDVCSRGGCN